MSRTMNGRRISLQVNAISSARSGGVWVTMTVSRVSAIIASRVQRRQEVQPRTLLLVEPGQALAGLEALLDGPTAAGDVDQLTQRHDLWGVAAVEGQLPGVG